MFVPHRLRVVSVLILLVILQLTINTPPVVQAADCEISLSTWTTVAPIPLMHLKGPSAFVNGRFYVLGGFVDSNLRVSSQVDVYNPQTNIWESVANPRRPTPKPMSHSAAVVDGKYIWLIGGFVGDNPGVATAEVWKYDTDNDLWYTAPALPQPRAAGAAVIAGRDLHYFGGASTKRDNNYPEHWVLNLDNPGAGWHSAPDFPLARIHQGSATVNGIIYAIGGQYKHDHNPVDLNILQSFNPANGQWTRKEDLGLPRSHFESATFVIAGKIVIVGGRANQSGAGNGQLKQASEYNPATDTWRELTPMPGKLISPNGFFYNDRIYITAGGSNWNTGNKKTYMTQVSYSNCGSAPTATATNPPAATATATNTATNPPAATATATNTEVIPPTATSTGLPTNTATTQPSNTPEPTATATDVVIAATNTPTVTATPVYSISGLKLINADTDTVIGNLTDNYTINCATIGTSNLNIRALTNPSVVGSIRFGLDTNTNYVTENGPPYTIGGNKSGNYLPWTPSAGTHILTVTPFTLKNRGGTAGIATIVHFTAQNCTAAAISARGSSSNMSLLPEDQAAVTLEALRFSWNAVPDASSYRLTIKRTDKKKTVATIVLNSADVCDNQVCSLDTSTLNLKLKPGHSYRWRIMARTTDGKVASNRSTFTIQPNLLPLP